MATLKKTKIVLSRLIIILMQVKSIAECSKGSILQYFRPSLNYHFVIKTFVLSIFEWPFYTGFTLYCFSSLVLFFCCLI